MPCFELIWPPQPREQKPLTTQHVWRCSWRRRRAPQPGQEVGLWPADWDPVRPGGQKEYVLLLLLLLSSCLHSGVVQSDAVAVCFLHISSEPDEVEGAGFSGPLVSIRRLRWRLAETLPQPQLRQVPLPQPVLRPTAPTLRESPRVSFLLSDCEVLNLKRRWRKINTWCLQDSWTSVRRKKKQEPRGQQVGLELSAFSWKQTHGSECWIVSGWKLQAVVLCGFEINID